MTCVVNLTECTNKITWLKENLKSEVHVTSLKILDMALAAHEGGIKLDKSIKAQMYTRKINWGSRRIWRN